VQPKRISASHPSPPPAGPPHQAPRPRLPQAAQPSAHPVPAVQRAVAPRTGPRSWAAPLSPTGPAKPAGLLPSSVVQAKILWNGTAAKFEGDGKRPGWRRHLKAHATQHYNAHFGTNHPDNVNFTSLDSDRTHKYPFSKIENVIVQFCNGAITYQALTDIASAILTPNNPQYGQMAAALKALIAAVPQSAPGTIARLANTLLGILKSSTDNVLSGADRENRGIGDSWDLNYTLTPQQTHYAPTPKGNNIFETTTRHGFGTDLPRSPGGQHYRTSQHGSERPLVSATLFPSVTGSSAPTQVSNSNGIASQTQTSASIQAQSHQLPTHHSQPQGVFHAPSLFAPPSQPSQAHSFPTQHSQPQSVFQTPSLLPPPSQPTQAHQLPTHHSQPQGVFPAPSLLSPPIFSQLNAPGPGYYPVGFYYIRFQGFQSIPQYCPPGFY
jgi:hypothetical protein